MNGKYDYQIAYKEKRLSQKVKQPLFYLEGYLRKNLLFYSKALQFDF